jgi:hypothetical protein
MSSTVSHPPLFTGSALVPPVLTGLIFGTLDFWAEKLGYVAPLGVALVIVFTFALCLGGIGAAFMGLKGGERPKAVGYAAIALNGIAVLLMLGWR